MGLAGCGRFSSEAAHTGSAILLNGSRRNITIQNGFIKGSVTSISNMIEGSGFFCGITHNGIWARVAMNCSGQAEGELGSGIYADEAMNCTGYGTGIGAYGIQTRIAIGCNGDSESGAGLKADVANSSRGSSLAVNWRYDMP